MDMTTKKDVEEDDDFDDSDLNPCFYDKKLQIFSFVNSFTFDKPISTDDCIVEIFDVKIN